VRKVKKELDRTKEEIEQIAKQVVDAMLAVHQQVVGVYGRRAKHAKVSFLCVLGVFAVKTLRQRR
jgi:hypothetical protein